MAKPNVDIYELLAQSIDLYDRANKEVEENGLVVTTKAGQIYANPAIKIRHNAVNQIIKICQTYKIKLTVEQEKKLKVNVHSNGESKIVALG